LAGHPAAKPGYKIDEKSMKSILFFNISSRNHEKALSF